MKVVKSSVMCIAIMSIMGCAVGPKYSPLSADAPSDWQTWHGGDAQLASTQWRDKGMVQSAQFVESLQDPVLSALIQRFNEHSPDLQTAVLRFAEVRAQNGSVMAQRGPQLSGSASEGRQSQSKNGASTRLIEAMGLSDAQKENVLDFLSQPFNLHQAGFDASWEIDLWGRVRHTIESAKANEVEAQAILNQVHVATEAELMRAYFELRGAQAQLRLARAQLDSNQRSQRWLQAKFKGGVIDQVDPSHARMNVDDAQNTATQLMAQEAQWMNQITILLGDAPGSWNAQLANQPIILNPKHLPQLDMGLPAQLAQHRPDIIQAQAQFQAAVANTGVAVADLYPRLIIGANAGLSSTSAEKFFDIGSLQWSIGPSLSIPIFDMGRRRSIITLRELQQQETAIHYQTTVLKVWHEVDSALSQYNADRQREQALADKEVQAQLLFRSTQGRFKGGLVDELPVLDAERGLIQIQQQHADVVKRLYIDLITLYKVLGGNALN